LTECLAAASTRARTRVELLRETLSDVSYLQLGGQR